MQAEQKDKVEQDFDDDKFKDTIQTFDEGNNQSIDTVELGNVLRAYGLNPTEQYIQDVQAKLDTNNDGIINIKKVKEFVKSAKLPDIKETKAHLKDAFELFFTDKKGFITSDQLKDVMKNYGEGLTDEDFDDLITDADTDGDGHIFYEDFIDIIVSDKWKL